MQTGVIADHHVKKTLTSISIIVPVYNQEKDIQVSLRRITNILEEAFSNYEIVVVNDGSIDNTIRILENEALNNHRLRVVSYSPNKGKGFAFKTGILASKGSLVLFTDGDLDITPDVIHKYIAELADGGIVIASKRHPNSIVKAPLSRILLSRAFNVIVRLLTGIELKDTQAGMKAGNGEIMREIFKIMSVKRYAFDVELLVIATNLNVRIKEMPVHIHLEKRFKTREIIRMFIDVLSIAYNYRIRRRYSHLVR